MEFVAEEVAQRVLCDQLQKARQLRQQQARQQINEWSEERRKRFEDEKRKQKEIIVSQLTEACQDYAKEQIQQLLTAHDLLNAEVGAAHRAAAVLRIAEVERKKRVEEQQVLSADRGEVAWGILLKDQKFKAQQQRQAYLIKQKARKEEDEKTKRLLELAKSRRKEALTDIKRASKKFENLRKIDPVQPLTNPLASSNKTDLLGDAASAGAGSAEKKEGSRKNLELFHPRKSITSTSKATLHPGAIKTKVSSVGRQTQRPPSRMLSTSPSKNGKYYKSGQPVVSKGTFDHAAKIRHKANPTARKNNMTRYTLTTDGIHVSNPVATCPKQSVVMKYSSTKHQSPSKPGTLLTSHGLQRQKFNMRASSASSPGKVRYFDTAIPQSESSYLAPTGLSVRIAKGDTGNGSPDAWDKAQAIGNSSREAEQEKQRRQAELKRKRESRGASALMKEHLQRQLCSLETEFELINDDNPRSESLNTCAVENQDLPTDTTNRSVHKEQTNVRDPSIQQPGSACQQLYSNRDPNAFQELDLEERFQRELRSLEIGHKRWTNVIDPVGNCISDTSTTRISDQIIFSKPPQNGATSGIVQLNASKNIPETIACEGALQSQQRVESVIKESGASVQNSNRPDETDRTSHGSQRETSKISTSSLGQAQAFAKSQHDSSYPTLTELGTGNPSSEADVGKQKRQEELKRKTESLGASSLMKAQSQRRTPETEFMSEVDDSANREFLNTDAVENQDLSMDTINRFQPLTEPPRDGTTKIRVNGDDRRGREVQYTEADSSMEILYYADGNQMHSTNPLQTISGTMQSSTSKTITTVVTSRDLLLHQVISKCLPRQAESIERLTVSSSSSFDVMVESDFFSGRESTLGAPGSFFSEHGSPSPNESVSEPRSASPLEIVLKIGSSIQTRERIAHSWTDPDSSIEETDTSKSRLKGRKLASRVPERSESGSTIFEAHILTNPLSSASSSSNDLSTGTGMSSESEEKLDDNDNRERPIDPTKLNENIKMISKEIEKLIQENQTETAVHVGMEGSDPTHDNSDEEEQESVMVQEDILSDIINSSMHTTEETDSHSKQEHKEVRRSSTARQLFHDNDNYGTDFASPIIPDSGRTELDIFESLFERLQDDFAPLMSLERPSWPTFIEDSESGEPSSFQE